MAWGAIAAAAGPSLISGLLGGGKKSTVTQVPLETPEQTAARKKLNEFSNTGVFGNFTAGADIPLGYGDYNTTGIENQGLSSLKGLLDSGLPSQFSLGDAALQDLLSTSPQQIEAQFNPFKTQVQRQITQSNRDLKRGAGFAGNLYSTNTIRGLGDIQARGNETLTAQLANLINEALNRRLQAIPLAYQSGTAQENILQNRLGTAFQYGGLTRNLNDASIKARDAELLRRRAELQLPIDAAKTVAGSNVQYGVPSVTTQSASPFQSVLDMASQIGGTYLGNELFKKQFPMAFGGGK